MEAQEIINEVQDYEITLDSTDQSMSDILARQKLEEQNPESDSDLAVFYLGGLK